MKPSTGHGRVLGHDFGGDANLLRQDTYLARQVWNRRRFPERGRENLDAVWSLAASGRIRPRVHAEFPLADWRAAFDAMARSDMVGKLILVP